ncbi:hypothetical protein FB567DRAFT_623854 [Paraphoma chrysanthemicola]|uniref:RZ-type domain-containing protein n=1 Tax=Paraphoma chrysanthemicola TaxID=798071 RepID=A0A8K0RIG9_9PLEO|nr:hypothetical protein FB567DRAFT_623854 [Paraphoma chrysanthemicola]
MVASTQCAALEDKFEIASLVKRGLSINSSALKFRGAKPIKQALTYLDSCAYLFDTCNTENLPKLAVESSLYFSRIARNIACSGLVVEKDRTRALEYREKAKKMLEKAAELCKQRFADAETLAGAVEQSSRLLGKEFYEEVTKEEIEAIKLAMLSGHGGIATHAGHWYNCQNGHPFAIGECGMPMEQALCPECGEHVGGQNHTAVAGVTRAVEMESQG